MVPPGEAFILVWVVLIVLLPLFSKPIHLIVTAHMTLVVLFLGYGWCTGDVAQVEASAIFVLVTHAGCFVEPVNVAEVFVFLVGKFVGIASLENPTHFFISFGIPLPRPTIPPDEPSPGVSWQREHGHEIIIFFFIAAGASISERDIIISLVVVLRVSYSSLATVAVIIFCCRMNGCLPLLKKPPIRGFLGFVFLDWFAIRCGIPVGVDPKVDISGNCLPEEEELVPRSMQSYGKSRKCTDQYHHTCTAQANYGGIEVDWSTNRMKLAVYTPHHEGEVEASSIIVDFSA